MTIPARVRRLGLVFLLGYLVVAGAAAYWQVVQADAVVAEPKAGGERLRLEEQRITRGRILDRHGNVLAETITQPDGTRQRRYADLGAVHIVGYTSERFGAAGMEAVGADVLLGRGDAAEPRDLLDDLKHLPRTGHDLRITLDSKIQQAAEQALGSAPGAVIALDPRSGEVLASVSVPGYDPNVSIDDQWEALQSAPGSPLVNRVTQGLYTPGSTFKTVTLLAGLEAKLFGPQTPVRCPERLDVSGFPVTSRNEPPGKTTRNVNDAFAYSCNTAFAEMGLQVGAERLEDMARALGILDEVPLPLPTVAGQLAGEPGYLDSRQGLAVTAFGQGQLQMTPLHLALVAAAIANNGVVPKPRLVLGEPAEGWRRAMSPETARVAAGIMEDSVKNGWAATGAVPGIRVAGKTGSAEVEPGTPSHAVFIAYAPAEAPRIAIAVLKERAGAGSAEAGPVVRAVLEAALR